MHLLVLGCGAILQDGKGSNCSGYLLDQSFLFDCGPGVWRALYQHNIFIRDVNDIFITHFHVDHTSDLAPLLLNRYLIPELLEQRLRLYGPQGLKNWFSKLKSLAGSWIDDMAIDLKEMSGIPYQQREYSIRSALTGHTENSICYRVEKEAKSFLYSGDSDYSESVIKLAESSNLAVFEASNTEETSVEGHLTPLRAARIAKSAEVKRLLLTHMYPDVLKGNPSKLAAGEFKGEILVAKDGMTVDF